MPISKRIVLFDTLQPEHMASNHTQRERSRSRDSDHPRGQRPLVPAGIWGMVHAEPELQGSNTELPELQGALATILAHSAATVDVHEDGTATLRFRHAMVLSLCSAGPASGGSSRPASGGPSWEERVSSCTVNNARRGKKTYQEFNRFWYTRAEGVDADDLHFQVLLGGKRLYWQALDGEVQELVHSQLLQGEDAHFEADKQWIDHNGTNVCTYKYDVLRFDQRVDESPSQMLRVIEEQKQKFSWIGERDLERVVGWQTNTETRAIRLIKYSASPNPCEHPGLSYG